jgi:hypothetical protein
VRPGVAEGAITPNYRVPTGQNLMVTSVDILPISNTVTSCPSDATTILELFTAGSIQNWALVGPDSAHYEYPTGLQLPPGTAIAFTSLIGSCNIIVDLHGYLTAN